MCPNRSLSVLLAGSAKSIVIVIAAFFFFNWGQCVRPLEGFHESSYHNAQDHEFHKIRLPKLSFNKILPGSGPNEHTSFFCRWWSPMSCNTSYNNLGVRFHYGAASVQGWQLALKVCQVELSSQKADRRAVALLSSNCSKFRIDVFKSHGGACRGRLVAINWIAFAEFPSTESASERMPSWAMEMHGGQACAYRVWL